MAGDNKLEYRVKELERKVRGLQTQNSTLNTQNKKQDQRLRDLEIRTAVLNGAPQKDVAEIYDISRGRVSQIVRRVS
jgi:TolA-binding protein